MAKVALERWRPHVEAATKAGVTLAQYAREHGLSRHTLYAASQALGQEKPRGGSARPRGGEQAAAFVPVQVSAGSAPALSVRLTNGVELRFDKVDSAVLAPLLELLAGLPCSA